MASYHPYDGKEMNKHGLMVPCASDPCKIHGDSDVQADNPVQAQKIYNARLRAIAKAQDENERRVDNVCNEISMSIARDVDVSDAAGIVRKKMNSLLADAQVSDGETDARTRNVLMDAVRFDDDVPGGSRSDYIASHVNNVLMRHRVELADDFNSSIGFDQRLYREDIEGSLAHAAMLKKQGIISGDDEKAIREGLLGILRDMEEGRIDFPPESEDIHMRVEELLTERVGEPGKRLHTGRSRNDQVALDMHLYAKRTAEEAIRRLYGLASLLLDLAEKHLNDIMPGYTHLQQAQPITLGHYLTAYFQMFLRDMKRFAQAEDAADEMVLGSGALAATTYPLDRPFVAEQLGFSRISMNSLDGVSNRDFLLDAMSASAICMMHLSRFCEELILWNTNEFRFVEMDDAFATGSSIMPQKKNPDVAELIRGKTGRVYGHLMGLLTVMKGLPLAYNKDMQEDKEAFFDTRDTLVKGLTVFTAMLKTVTFRKDVMERGASGGFTNATDCADYLVKKGVAFRDAHKVVGELVAHCLDGNKALLDLSLEELKQFHPAFEQDVFDDLSMSACVEKRKIPGAPAPEMVQQAIESARRKLEG